MHRYRELKIWQRSISFVKPVYKLSESFPDDEKYGITQQIRRAVASISMNISEGAGRKTDKDFSHFLDMAIGSLFEVENCIYIALELEYIKDEYTKEIFNETEELLKMIIGFQNKLNNK